MSDANDVTRRSFLTGSLSAIAGATLLPAEAEIQAKIREEREFGSLEETKNWLRTNSKSQSSYGIQYIDFQGNKLAWSYCSIEKLKRDDCRTYMVVLNDLNLDQVSFYKNSSGTDEYFVRFETKGKAEVINSKRTYKGKPYGNTDYSSIIAIFRLTQKKQRV